MKNPIRQIEGTIVSIKKPFSLFRKSQPIVTIRNKRGSIFKMEATQEMIDDLPISIGVGMYTEAEYREKEDGKGYILINLY